MNNSYKNLKVTKYGGLIPIIKELKKKKIHELIDSYLNKISPRAKQAKYEYSDMIISWIASCMCGSYRIDHITNLKDDLLIIPGLNVPSHDNIAYQMKKLVSDVKIEERKMNHQVNRNYYDDNIPLNKLLIEITKQIGGLKTDKEYILDVDCTFINTNCRDALSMKDKDQFGFYPMICLIDNFPVFISMRNGNSIADFRIKDCVEDCLNLLEDAGIKVKLVRTDGAGYRTEYLDMLSKKRYEFLTSSPVNKFYKRMFFQFENSNWKDVKIETANHFKDCQISEISYKMWNSEIPYRVIALKIPTESKLISTLTEEELEFNKKRKEKMKILEKNKILKSKNSKKSEWKWNEVDSFQYKMITTSDWETSAEDLMILYNQRGTRERDFSFMKNDFGWKYPPFSKMNQNTVFMIISSIANNVFRAIVEKINTKDLNIKKIQLPQKTRIRNFQKIFIEVIAILDELKWNFINSKFDYLEIL